jgi:Large polyvalent protein associated domain 38
MQLEDLFGEKASGAIYRPAIINEKGEAIAFFRDGGELKALRLADGEFGKDMHNAMTMMNGRENNVFVNMLSKSGALLRAGITSSPDFLIANFIRDQTVAAIFYGKPIKRIVGAAVGMRDELFGRDAARMYNMAGGIMGGAQVAGIRDARLNSDINALRRKGWVATRITSLHGWLEATGISETGMRIGLFKDFFDEAKGRGLSDHEAMLEAAYQARDHIDFDRRGSQMMGISRIVPFLNASLQGVDKAWRQMVQPIFRENLTVAEQAARGEAYKAWARIAALTVATMGLHALMSQHDEYKDFSPQTRATHWVIKWGDTWFVIPKPFELGGVLNAGNAAYDAMVRHDPRWSEEYLQGLYEVVMPPNVLKGNPAIASSYEYITGVDLRSGQPIVPDHLAGLKPWLQYDQRTSEMFKVFGKATNTSPMFVQNMFEQHTGSLGRAAISLYDMALSDKPTQGWDDAAFTRRFIKDATRGASSTRAFWDLVGSRNGKLEGARKSWEAMNQAGDPASAADFLASQDTPTKAWIAAGAAKPDIRRIHPYMRARSAVSAINDLRRDIVQSTIETASGTINVPAQQRGAADDILSKLAMTEARNALVMMKVPGWADRTVMETAGYYRELQSLSPDMAKALADRFATAKVLPLDIVEKLWPETQRRLLQDGSKMRQEDLIARAKAAGFEMDGKAIKRKPRAAVPAG